MNTGLSYHEEKDLEAMNKIKGMNTKEQEVYEKMMTELLRLFRRHGEQQTADVIEEVSNYNPEQVEQKEDINPETGESYFDGINGDKLTRHLPPEQKEGDGEDQDKLWVEFMSDYEWYFIDKLKSKYHLTKKQP